MTTQINAVRPPLSRGNSLSTPALSPSASTDVSPILSQIVSPPLNPNESLDIDLPITADVALPECWGHRGASATYPENTKASFIEAIKAGADGLETAVDIHAALDDVLVLFHDPNLERTTNGKGKINNLPWDGVLEQVRTTKAPHQPIPLFREVLEILVNPENRHVKLNIDCKVDTEPVRLFTLMKAVIESFPGWTTLIAPRLILGIWHPRFIEPAATILPFLPRYAISMSIHEARSYFLPHCQGLSLHFPALASADGQRLLEQCRDSGKAVCVWTVNDEEEMKECVRWGVQSVITDKPDLWRKLRAEILADREKALAFSWKSVIRPWTKRRYWAFDHLNEARKETEYLESHAGKMSDVVVPDISLRVARPADVL
ncbi:hypothetical protein M231_03967 [Tremella mesenterica]|uniref:GP-PDE domain-containing protein n=1 Tax=Tremella mesenterica TaxID=5217 RepID=A0A4Q1BLW2_TREME|nr:uncharacterized protein TREMEDRAFT_34209 [Tremella mesenterica DSM 1558]EIW66936.1 hypothetical protein TREMEDRAFT_34209 [Tremella mesenterica DSM 1558]RXK38791.1 hypothetical protein M231_03967 [Tremella mesenterica]